MKDAEAEYYESVDLTKYRQYIEDHPLTSDEKVISLSDAIMRDKKKDVLTFDRIQYDMKKADAAIKELKERTRE